MKKISIYTFLIISLFSISVFANVPGGGGCGEGTRAICIAMYDENDKVYYVCHANDNSQLENDCK